MLEFRNGITATERGNLKRAFVAVMFEEIELDQHERMFIKNVNKVINEKDVYPLHIIEIVCELEELINHLSKNLLAARKH